MEGYLKITATPDDNSVSLDVETRLENVGFEDEVFLLNAFASALDMSDEELRAIVEVRGIVCANSVSAKVDRRDL